MELPIQLKFFKKLELYQELKRQDKKARSAPDSEKVWRTEKEILIWASKELHRIFIPISATSISRDIFKDPQSPAAVAEALRNLEVRGYLKKDEHQLRYFFTQEGLLMGEVIYDTQPDFGFSYLLFYWLAWITVLAGAFTVIITFLQVVGPYLNFILAMIFNK